MTNINKGYGISDIESGSSDMDVSSGEDDTVMTVDALKRDQVSDLGDEGVDLAPVSFTRKVGQHVRDHYAHPLPIIPKVEPILSAPSKQTSSQKVVSMQKPSYVTSVTSTQNTEAIIISDDDDDNLVAEAEDDEDSDRFFTPPSSPRLMDTRELARTSMTTTPTMAATNVGMTAAYWKEKKAQQELIDKLRQQVQEQGRENSKYRKLLDNQQKQQGEVQRQLSALEGQSAAAKTKMAEIQNKLNMAEHTLKDLNTTLLRLEVNLSMTKNKKKKPSKSATLAPSPIKKPDTKMSQNDIQQAKKEKGKRVETQPPPPPPPPGQQEQQEQEGQQQQQQQHLSHSQKKNRRKKARGKGKANTPSTDNPMISDNEVEGATNAPLTQHNATDGQRQSISMATLNIPDGSAMLPSKDDASIQGGPLTVAAATATATATMVGPFSSQLSAIQQHTSRQHIAAQTPPQFIAVNNRPSNQSSTTVTPASDPKSPSFSPTEASKKQQAHGMSLPARPFEPFNKSTQHPKAIEIIDIDGLIAEEEKEEKRRRESPEEGEIEQKKKQKAIAGDHTSPQQVTQLLPQQPTSPSPSTSAAAPPSPSPPSVPSPPPPSFANQNTTNGKAFRPYRSAFASLGIRNTNAQPQNALCPAETTGGICHDPKCKYSHFSDYGK